MASIVTVNRGAQSGTPFGFNSGQKDADRGSAFFTDFYELGPITVGTDFALVDGDGGVLQNSSGADASHCGTDKIYTGALGSTMSFACRFKMSARTNGDIAGFGMAPASNAALSGQATRLGFTITQATAIADDTVSVEFDDTTTDGTTVITTAGLPDGYDSTNYHIYGVELTRDSQGGVDRNRAAFYVDGKLIKEVVGSGAALPAHKWMCYQGAETSLATFDWLSFSGPRPS